MPGKITADVRRQVEEGIAVLKEGGIVAFPTDTVYGLGACFNIARAVERVYSVKQRPRTMALPLLLSGILEVSEVAHPVPGVAWLLAANFWPGALTLVLHRSRLVPDIITAGAETVAVRVPAHPVPLALVEGAGVPIVGTSANLSGRPSLLTAREVRAELGDSIDLIVSGRSPGGTESTVVDVTGETPVVLREGAISVDELERVCGNVITSRKERN